MTCPESPSTDPATQCGVRWLYLRILADSLTSKTMLGLAIVPIMAQFCAAQNQLWIRQFGTSGLDESNAAAPDGSGGVYISGFTLGSLGGPKVGSNDAWLARYDGAGNQYWIRQFGTSVGDESYAAASDGAGGVYVSGFTIGSLGGPAAGAVDVWLARYDSAGNQLWTRQFGTGSSDWSRSAAPDGSSGVYVTGSTKGSLGAPYAGGVHDIWLAHYDGAGNQLWVRQFGTTSSETSIAAASDTTGGVYISGLTDGSLGAPNAGGNDAWLARYDGAGNQLWIRQFGTSQEDGARGAAPDGSNGVFLGGYTSGSLNGPNAGGLDAWLARYDSTGNQIWIRQLGTSVDDEAFAVAPDGSSGAYVTGYTSGSLGAPSAGSYDVWLAHYDGAGNQLWIRQLGSSALERSYAAAADGSGGVYVSGPTRGNLGAANAGLDDIWLARYGPQPLAYCTAKTNSCGTLPMISSTGTPSSTVGSGFTVGSTNTKALKAGLLIYTDSGPGSFPFGGGILCLNPSPLKRSIAVIDTSGTPGQCDGTLSIDMNAFAVGALGGNPLQSLTIPGTQVNCQFWGRDTLANGALLSDALKYFVGS